ncbi:hypothetical protein HII28_19660 [Planctomonas sp. JC2975]|uniref:hypothetical protein n=1 Tax=Planctomonas sp. JC2975 TaxID=2729626 RepID=UPI00147517FC|nr:hypothetical protein [Planctomonas sp. JC2975]NNC14081.1 hypothetical protein [Planctomonas sp. JC2975]
MGGQTRYVDNVDRRIAYAMEVAVTRPQPVSLTEAELDLEHNRVTHADEPIKVRAFVRFHEAVIRPRAEAVAWTPRAVKIRFTMQNGARHEVWVWASAVDRI